MSSLSVESELLLTEFVSASPSQCRSRGHGRMAFDRGTFCLMCTERRGEGGA